MRSYRPYTPQEDMRLRQLLATAGNGRVPYGEVKVLAKEIDRSPGSVSERLKKLKDAGRPRYELIGVMIDDFGVSHAELITRLRGEARA